MTDAKSRLKRKNVPGLLRAFRESYSQEPDNCLLLIKISDPHTEAESVEEICRLADGLPVKFIFDTVSDEEINGLLRDCDCYVSLHRSEGYGLTLAEAMSLGRPVIATGYSGNLEFMNTNNSFLVRYEMREEKFEDVDELFGCGPWAFADELHAAELMTFVRKNPSSAERIGQTARLHINDCYSPKIIGQRMRERLELLLQTATDGVRLQKFR